MRIDKHMTDKSLATDIPLPLYESNNNNMNKVVSTLKDMELSSCGRHD